MIHQHQHHKHEFNHVCEECNIGLARPEVMERSKIELTKEFHRQRHWMYLSFAEDRPPKGRGFLGGIYLQARGITHALCLLHLRGINPGGEVIGVDQPPDSLHLLPAPEYRNRILNKQEMIEAHADQGGLVRLDGSPADEDTYPQSAA